MMNIYKIGTDDPDRPAAQRHRPTYPSNHGTTVLYAVLASSFLLARCARFWAA